MISENGKSFEEIKETQVFWHYQRNFYFLPKNLLENCLTTKQISFSCQLSAWNAPKHVKTNDLIKFNLYHNF